VENAAAISAQIVDIRNDDRHKGFIKVTIHVPAELGQSLDVFGWPTYTTPVPVALARLRTDVAATTSGIAAPVSDPDPPARARPKQDRLFIWAVKACGDVRFWTFLRLTDPHGWMSFAEDVEPAVRAASLLRKGCNVTSRKEIRVGTPAGDLWEKWHSAYTAWVMLAA